MTNFENIKSMSIEEMAEHFENTNRCVLCPAYKSCMYYVSRNECKNKVKQWLESEVTEE